MTKTISRRLKRLEQRLKPELELVSGIETEATLRMSERLDAGKRRVAAFRGEEVPLALASRPNEVQAPIRAPTLSQQMVEILHAGRKRVADAHAASLTGVTQA